MRRVTREDLKKLYVPPPGSHKGQNGRLLIIGGSHLFHAASLWALTVASRIVDLVHYSSVPENNVIVAKAKEEFRNGIVVPRGEVDAYIDEDDCILIGPGMTRDEETKELTDRLLIKHPKKQWVIDAGALQMLDLSVIPKNAILTPHHGEFASLFTRAKVDTPWPGAATLANENLDPSSEKLVLQSSDPRTPKSEAGLNFVGSTQPFADGDKVKWFAKQHQCIVLLKGEKDIACVGEGCDPSDAKGSHPSGFCVPGECRVIEGGNAGMTKGGTGDVLAGLIAALACKNDPFLATIAGSFINKKAGDALYQTVGPYFNATDLANQIPKTMKELLLR